MAWTGKTWVVGAILTANQMNNFQYDITSAFLKEAGAPVLADDYVVLAMMGDNSVAQINVTDDSIGRAELKMSTEISLAGSLTGGSGVNIALTNYAFFPMIHTTQAAAIVEMTGHTVDGASADNPRFRLDNNQSGADVESYDVDYRYILS